MVDRKGLVTHENHCYVFTDFVDNSNVIEMYLFIYPGVFICFCMYMFNVAECRLYSTQKTVVSENSLIQLELNFYFH